MVQYLHTDVIVESQLSAEDKRAPQRRGQIDVVAKHRFKVKNTEDLIESTWRREQDFGPFVPFEFGEAKDEKTQEIFANYGAWVGAQAQHDVRFASEHPVFWFSLGGSCPNKPFAGKCEEVNDDGSCSTLAGDCLWDEQDDTAVVGGLCEGGAGDVHGDNCAEDGDDCKSTLCCKTTGSHCFAKNEDEAQCREHCSAGMLDFAEPRPERTPWSCELLSSPAKLPTGKKGCVYTYGDPDMLELDEVVGITQLDCGGRKCTNWHDFRKSCTNEDYKKVFDSDGSVKAVDYCVEYDIHPTCALRCAAVNEKDEKGRACETLRADPKATVELGLPFWRNRCEPKHNHRRMEVFADRLGVVGSGTKHTTVDSGILQMNSPCIVEGSSACVADFQTGENYCDRSFSGVCAKCFLPGTVKSSGFQRPFCSLSVLKSLDYAGDVYAPECKSTYPSDLCCLYTGDCVGDHDPSSAVVGDEGLILVAARMDTDGMVEFLSRAAEERGLGAIKDRRGFRRAAYEEWRRQPIFRSLDEVMSDVAPFFAPPKVTSTLPPTVPVQGTGSSWLTSVVLIVVLVGPVVGVAYLLRSKSNDQARRARNPAATELQGGVTTA